ncbi:MAG: TonB family protein [Sphaerochaeta sp.]|nr:TonB family protein [Sphaerochaeta sp.]
MNILRTSLITILVIAASLAALLIPLNMAAAAEQPQRATGATISLVDSLPSAKASIPSIPEQPKTTTAKTEVIKPPVSIPSPAVEELLPSSDKGIGSVEVDPEPTSKPSTEQDPLMQEEPILDSEVEPTPSSLDESPSTDSSVASAAASAVSSDPRPSLVDGYYEATSIDQGPIFDRTVLASKIKYPALAKRQGIEGVVLLRLFISSSGKVERIEVEEDPGYGLAQAAVKAFTGLKGKPAIFDGKAVPVMLRYPVRFILK